jgi:RNA polymerase sigma factor (sigma-70 family)
MATASSGTLLRHLHRLAAGPGGAPWTDRQLLEDFTTRHDEAAFAALVSRHGPMVLRVCRRVLGHEQDAEDAFQATFLVLAQHTGAIRKRDAVADWLHGVAHRTALNAKRRAARRRHNEARLRATTPPVVASLAWDDVQAVLDEEVQRLPPCFREAFVLCVLEGKGGAEAAAELGCKAGTVKSRVNRARRLLRQALARRGIQLAALAAAEGAGRAALPDALPRITVRSGLLVAAGEPAAGVIPPHVARLATGVTRAMFLSRARIAVILLVAAGLLIAAGTFTRDALGARETPPPSGKAESPAPNTTQAQPAGARDEAGDTVEVSGRVLDPAGQPFAGAKVYCQPRHVIMQADPQPGFARVRATTDADGRFHFRVVRSAVRPAEDEETRFVYNAHPQALVTAVGPGYGPAWAALRKPADAAQVTLKLVRDDVPINGRVVDLEGRPIPAVTVRVMCLIPLRTEDLQPWLNALRKNKDGGLLWKHQGAELYPQTVGLEKPVVTGADGRFRLAGIGRERLVALRFEGPTIETRGAYAMTRPGPSFELPQPTIPPTSSDAYYGASFDHAAAPTMPVVGTVRDKDTGNPLAGITIQARIPSAFGGADAEGGSAQDYLRTTTDQDGHYRLVGLPRVPGLIVRALPSPGQPYFRYGQKTRVGNGLEPVRLDFQLKRGIVIRGRVTDRATGKPVMARVEYFLFSDNQEYAEGAGDFREGGAIETATGADGSFTLVGLPRRGIVAARVWSARPGRYIEGAGAERIPGAVGNRTFLTYPYVCQALRFHGLAEVNPARGADSVVCDLALDPGKTVTGTVLGPDGKPFAGAHVEVPGHRGGELQRLASARFTLTGIDPRKPRPALFFHQAKQLGAAILLTGDEKDLTVRLRSCATVTGRVVDADGQPRAGVELAGFLEGDLVGPLAGQGGFSGVRTDKDGRFRITGLIPGLTWRNVYVQEGNELTGRVLREVTFRPGETRDLGDLKPLSLED